MSLLFCLPRSMGAEDGRKWETPIMRGYNQLTINGNYKALAKAKQRSFELPGGLSAPQPNFQRLKV
jgi:hypothetical protein